MAFPSFAARIFSWRCSSSDTSKFIRFLSKVPPCFGSYTHLNQSQENLSRKLRMAGKADRFIRTILQGQEWTIWFRLSLLTGLSGGINEVCLF